MATSSYTHQHFFFIFLVKQTLGFSVHAAHHFSLGGFSLEPQVPRRTHPEKNLSLVENGKILRTKVTRYHIAPVSNCFFFIRKKHGVGFEMVPTMCTTNDFLEI